ncbi:MAG: hypothetical protein Q8Q12_12065 [bacterium]|nr:hypothetical protein [bacterium]
MEADRLGMFGGLDNLMLRMRPRFAGRRVAGRLLVSPVSDELKDSDTRHANNRYPDKQTRPFHRSPFGAQVHINPSLSNSGYQGNVSSRHNIISIDNPCGQWRKRGVAAQEGYACLCWRPGVVEM